MRNTKLAVLGVAALAMTLATGCAKPPQVEIDGLKSAMDAAEQAGATTYAADAWNSAQQAMNAVTAEVDAQANKFALFRSYTRTKELIAAANQAATEAADAAVAGKAAAADAANGALMAVQSSVEAANTAMAELAACRRQPKDFKKDLEAMKGNLDGLAAQVANVSSAIAAEDYYGAKAQADSLTASIDTLTADMQAAKEKIKC